MGVIPARGGWLTATTVGAGTGLVGVLSGFALFILLWQEPERDLSEWAWVMVMAGAFALLFEFLKARIEGHNLSSFSLPRIFATVLLLLAFELFADALHTAFSMSKDDLQVLGVAILGPGIMSQVYDARMRNLEMMAIAWLLIGAVVGGALGHVMEGIKQSPSRLRVRSVVIALGVAPLCVLVYVLLMRVLAYHTLSGLGEVVRVTINAALVWTIPTLVSLAVVPLAVWLLRRAGLGLEAYWPVAAIGSALVVLLFTWFTVPGFLELQRQSLSAATGLPPDGTIAERITNDTSLLSPVVMPTPADHPEQLLPSTAAALGQVEARLAQMTALAGEVIESNDEELRHLLLVLQLGTPEQFEAGEQGIGRMGRLTILTAFFDRDNARMFARLQQRLRTGSTDALAALAQAQANLAHAGATDGAAVAAVRGGMATVASRRAKLVEVETAFTASLDWLARVEHRATEHLPEWRDVLARRMLLTFNGALGFWLAVGMLASRVWHNPDSTAYSH
jgi:hypothetical protein